MLRRLINDALDRTARTNTLKALGNHLHNTVWNSTAHMIVPTIGGEIHDSVANAVRNVDLNVYAKVDLIIGTKI